MVGQLNALVARAFKRAGHLIGKKMAQWGTTTEGEGVSE